MLEKHKSIIMRAILILCYAVYMVMAAWLLRVCLVGLRRRALLGLGAATGAVIVLLSLSAFELCIFCNDKADVLHDNEVNISQNTVNATDNGARNDCSSSTSGSSKQSLSWDDNYKDLLHRGDYGFVHGSDSDYHGEPIPSDKSEESDCSTKESCALDKAFVLNLEPAPENCPSLYYDLSYYAPKHYVETDPNTTIKDCRANNVHTSNEQVEIQFTPI